jgi:SulP family sulfate permease
MVSYTSLQSLPRILSNVYLLGLIFLSSMASSIMTELGPSVPIEERLATVLVHLSLSTMFVGLGLIIIGKLRLASLVQYLPTPVIGKNIHICGQG